MERNGIRNQTELATKLGLTQSSISSWNAGFTHRYPMGFPWVTHRYPKPFPISYHIISFHITSYHFITDILIHKNQYV